MLLLAFGLLTTTVTLVVFATTTLVEEPAAALVATVALAVGLDLWWKRARRAQATRPAGPSE